MSDLDSHQQDHGEDRELDNALRRLADSVGDSARPMPVTEVRRRGRARRARRVTVTALAAAGLLLGGTTLAAQYQPTSGTNGVAARPTTSEGEAGPSSGGTPGVRRNPDGSTVEIHPPVDPTAGPQPTTVVVEPQPTQAPNPGVSQPPREGPDPGVPGVPGVPGEPGDPRRDALAPPPQSRPSNAEVEAAVRGAMLGEGQLGVSGLGSLQRSALSGTDNCVPYTVGGPFSPVEREDRYSTDSANGWVWQSARIFKDADQAGVAARDIDALAESCAPDNESTTHALPGGGVAYVKSLECRDGRTSCKPRVIVAGWQRVGRTVLYMQYTKDKEFGTDASRSRMASYFGNVAALPLCANGRCDSS